MRRARGNIILTAIFISVFLFFLSIALIWTNRQDIQLSLAMEHKMKGEAAARSGAMRVYATLRNVGQPPVAMEGTLDNGAAWKAELVELPAEGDRGPLVLLHCRGTSGPLSSYYTMHLLKTDLGHPANAPERSLAFLKPTGGGTLKVGSEQRASSGSPEEQKQSSEPVPPELSSSAKFLDAEFMLKSVDLAMGEGVDSAAAYQGPLFMSVNSTLLPPKFPLQAVAYIPVFSLTTGALKAFGPVVLNAPPVTEKALSVLTVVQGDQLKWEMIPYPESDEDPPQPAPIAALDFQDPNGSKWNTLGVHALEELGVTHSWRDEQPATREADEASELGTGEPFEIEIGKAIEWGAARPTPAKRGYALRGSIAAYKDNVYSHAWEYLYLHYDGGPLAPPIPPTAGSVMIRWPCVRKYNLESKKWTTAWSGLKDNGDVFSKEVPSDLALVANNEGVCWALSSDDPPRLLRLDPSGSVQVGPEVPSQKIFLYKEQPYTVSIDPKEPGIRNLVTKNLIGFDSLPAKIPEIAGPLIAEMPDEESNPGLSPLEISPLSGDPELPQMRTVRCPYEIRYEVDPDCSPASDGDDLYVNLKITVSKQAASYEVLGKFDFNSGGTILARYDGQRWHILPHGLIAVLTSSVETPGPLIFALHYPGQEAAKSRYTVVAIDTDPFEFSR